MQGFILNSIKWFGGVLRFLSSVSQCSKVMVFWFLIRVVVISKVPDVLSGLTYVQWRFVCYHVGLSLLGAF